MKVLIFGGIIQSLLNFRLHLINGLLRRKVELAVMAGNNDINSEKALAGLGVDYYCGNFERGNLSILSQLTSLIRIRKIFSLVSPDLVIAYTAKPIIYCGLMKWCGFSFKFYPMITGLGYAFTADTIFARVLRFVMIGCYRLSLLKSSGIIFQNNDDLNLFIKTGVISSSKPVIVVGGSGVDLDYFKRSSYPKKVRFLMISRFLWTKGISEFLAAAQVVSRAVPDVEFGLLGEEDPENPANISLSELEEMTKLQNLTLHPPTKDVRSTINKYNVIVLPSYREGLPRSVLEAMAMECAVITTDTVGCRETVVSGRNGYLVPVAAIEELVDAFKACIRDSDGVRKMGLASREICASRFNARVVTSDILDFVVGEQ